MTSFLIFFSFMFLHEAFCANIVAVLQSTSNSIQTLEDLYTTDISLGAENVVYSKSFFKSTTEPLRKAIVDEKLQFMSAEEGVGRVKNEFFAFHSERGTIYNIVTETFTDAEVCTLREIRFFGAMYSTTPHLTVPKNSTYKELLKNLLIKMREAGIMHCEHHRLFTGKPKCLQQGNFGSVGITECYAIYVIFGTGIGCSFALLLLEILWKYTTGNSYKRRLFVCRNVFKDRRFFN